MSIRVARTEVRRYSDGVRLTHWAVVLLFIVAVGSGMALFHPALFFLSNLFGGGPWTRTLHPYLGIGMFVLFVPLALVMVRANLFGREDARWLRQAGQMMRSAESHEPPTGRYNAGQKLVFWSMLCSLAVLLVTGLCFWHAWFPQVPVPYRRIAVVLHAAAAVVLVLTVVVHAYAAFWVKGTMRAMTRGTVTRAWAAEHHPLWLAQLQRDEQAAGRGPSAAAARYAAAPVGASAGPHGLPSAAATQVPPAR